MEKGNKVLVHVFEEIIGKEISGYTVPKYRDGDIQCLVINFSDGTNLFLTPEPCCWVEDLEGFEDLKVLVGSVVIKAEERTNSFDEDERPDGNHEHWTYYCFATVKGYADISFRIMDNGYYTSSVEVFLGEGKQEPGYGATQIWNADTPHYFIKDKTDLARYLQLTEQKI